MLAKFVSIVINGRTYLMSRMNRNADLMQLVQFLQIEVIEKKLPWIHFNGAADDFKEAKIRLRNTQESLAQRKQDFMNSQEPLR